MEARPSWPKRPDGTPKKLGEMTKEEQRAQILSSCKELERELRHPAFAKALANPKQN